jgi:hypothetical protein
LARTNNNRNFRVMPIAITYVKTRRSSLSADAGVRGGGGAGLGRGGGVGGGGGPGGFGILPDGAMHISMGDLIGGFTSVKGRDRLVEHSLGRARSASSSMGRWRRATLW